MTPVSMGLALGVSLVVALLVGWLATRAKLSAQAAAAWAMAIAWTSAVSVLSAGTSHEYGRWLRPREALDWLPMFVLVLAVIESLRKPGRFARVAGWAGTLLCVAIAFRLLYGSVYLRPSNFQLSIMGLIALWSCAIAMSWRSQLYPSHNSTDERSWSYSFALVGLMLLTAVILGMSGSILYAVVGCVTAVAASGCWAVTGRLPASSAALVPCMLGLSHAFAELSLPVTVGMTAGWLGMLLSVQVIEKRFRWLIVTLSLLIMLVCSGSVLSTVWWPGSRDCVEAGGYKSLK